MMRVLQRVLVLVLVIPAFTTGCKDSSPLEGTPQDTLSRILERGEMRVGFLVWGPCIMQDAQTRELSGIYVDMVVQIARALNVEISWQETTLAAFAADLQTRRFDFSVGPTFMTIPRAAAVSFTQPVAYSGNSGVVRTNSPFRPQTIVDLNAEDLKIAVLQGQAVGEYCQRNLPDADLLVLSGDDLTAPLAAVSSGRADIGLMNSVTVSEYSKQHPEVTAVLMGAQQIETLPLAWAVKHGDTSLLNASIDYLRSTGRLAAYQKSYESPLLYDTPLLHKAR